MKTTGIGTSHAKIILIGEHSVVYGQPAIALPLPEVKLTVTITKLDSEQQLLDSRYFSGSITEAPENMLGIKTLILALINQFDGQSDGWKMNITSMLPAERGMGSSAASAIAIIRAFFDYYDRQLSRETLLKLADIEEKITHRSPSGLDAATTSAINPIWFVKGHAGQHLAMNVTGTLVIADSGVKGQTGDAIKAVKEQLLSNKEATVGQIETLGNLAKETKTCLQNGNSNNLGIILSRAQTQLKLLNVSHPSVDNLIQVAMDNQALGAKLTGGGRGGCIIALVKDAATAQSLSVKLIDAGATATWIQPLQGGNNDTNVC
ncbi:mevalonate kinase [Paucilactobacillus hokkaidonensis JCM 18461]|uniref:Mevalonate kinase n=2 Tax=Paucilactobacillus hokkaidonensis TaxID=1193095 RepID=A0A0A1GXE8_9LACO|nr:mevalonate kinase [Paucilactobacillus hokkaidonensis]BAP85608.1 mevalonate kinase [Paucilactobacillus hokkaidonensis JCM 18461]